MNNLRFSLNIDKQEISYLSSIILSSSKNNKNILTGYTKQNMLVNFNDDKERPCQIGDLIQVKITKAYSWHLFGEVLK